MFAIGSLEMKEEFSETIIEPVLSVVMTFIIWLVLGPHPWSQKEDLGGKEEINLNQNSIHQNCSVKTDEQSRIKLECSCGLVTTFPLKLQDHGMIRTQAINAAGPHPRNLNQQGYEGEKSPPRTQRVPFNQPKPLSSENPTHSAVREHLGQDLSKLIQPSPLLIQGPHVPHLQSIQQPAVSVGRTEGHFHHMHADYLEQQGPYINHPPIITPYNSSNSHTNEKAKKKVSLAGSHHNLPPQGNETTVKETTVKQTTVKQTSGYNLRSKAKSTSNSNNNSCIEIPVADAPVNGSTESQSKKSSTKKRSQKK